MPGAIGFDIYGTLVDPLEMNEHLRPVVGEKLADRFSELWRNKQIEYTFRRALMRRYEDFGICTRQALVHTATVLDVDLTDEEQERLVEDYQSLRPFPEVERSYACRVLQRRRGDGQGVVGSGRRPGAPAWRD